MARSSNFFIFSTSAISIFMGYRSRRAEIWMEIIVPLALPGSLETQEV